MKEVKIVRNVFEFLFLLALPASGKSEVRTFLKTIDRRVLREQFHIGDTIQLDDYPYVWFMRRVDEELKKMGLPPLFFPHPQLPFINPGISWRVLIELLNQDFRMIKKGERYPENNCTKQIFERIDLAHLKFGSRRQMISELSGSTFDTLVGKLEAENRNLIEKRNQEVQSLDGKTVIIEFARGGPAGALYKYDSIPFGYYHSLTAFDMKILLDAAILYIWVTAEQAIMKNFERAVVGEEGSIFSHCVPYTVMATDYGCDDIDQMLEQSKIPGFIEVETMEEGYSRPTIVQTKIPTVKFDNRIDLTSFVRKPKAEWTEVEINALTAGLLAVYQQLWDLHLKRPIPVRV